MASSILEDTIPCARLRIDHLQESLGEGNGALEFGGEPSSLSEMQPVHG